MDQPVTRYTESNGLLIAYQVFGDGKTDLITSLGLASNCDHLWDIPANARTLEELGRYFRVINFDRRGTGHSDPVPSDSLPTWEDWADDLLTVMDAVGSDKAAVHGDRDGGIMAMLFAALHPERVLALTLGNTTARYLRAPDYAIGLDREQGDLFVDLLRRSWGSEELSARFSPEFDAHDLRMSARMLRGAATPRQAAIHFRYLYELDLRPILRSISVPTMVMHRTGNEILPHSHGRFIAEQIPGAKFVELPGVEAASLFGARDAGQIVHRMVEFFTGDVPDAHHDRALVTVLFCDIVDSTRRAAELGDDAWHALLERFHTALRAELARFGGREVDTAGDGMFMAFDRPTRAIGCARALGSAVRALGLDVRCGVHSGECTMTDGRLTGMAVHIGARVAASAAPGEVWLTDTVRALTMGSGIAMAERGVHELKGVPGTWALFAVAGVSCAER